MEWGRGDKSAHIITCINLLIFSIENIELRTLNLQAVSIRKWSKQVPEAYGKWSRLR